MAKKRPTITRRVAKAQEVVISKQKPIDINYKIAPDLGLLYADQFVIQFYADEFVVSFFQTEHPLIFSGEDFDERDELDAGCIARFVLNPNQMGRFVVGINQNFQRWREIHIPKDEDVPRGEDAK